MRIADYIIDKLYEEGVSHVFMITGRGILYLSDAVARHSEMQYIAMHNEQAVAYAADAYAQYNNKIGACLVSTGCAATNAITGALCAWQDNIPCIFISGQNYLKETVRYTGERVRTFGQQENDIIELVKPITKYAVMLESADQAVYEVEKALYLAQSGRKGPVWIDVPLDIQNARIDIEQVEHYIPEPVAEANHTADIDYLVKELHQAKRPVLLAGWGIRNAGAEALFCDFAGQTQIPVVFTSAVPDLYSFENRNSIGVVSSLGGSRAANFTIQNADFVLAIGSRLSPMTTGEEYEKFIREGKLVVIDADKSEHCKNTVHVDYLIDGDIRVILEQLLDRKVTLNIESWTEKCCHWKQTFDNSDMILFDEKKIDLYYFCKCLQAVLPSDGVLCTDAGLEEVIIPTNFQFRDGQRCIHPVSQGAMGFALPAAIGISQETKGCVTAVVGDGSVMMNLQELATIEYQKSPIKVIIINNNGYSIIRRRQQDMFRTRTIGNDRKDGVGIPDFKKIATGFGIPYFCVDEFDKLEDELRYVLAQEGPVICEVISEENQRYIHSSYARNKNRKIVKRPLEDQSPYIDRELFLREMIVEPIDQ